MIKYTFWKISLVAAKKKKKNECGKTGDWEQGRHASRTNKSIN